MHWLKKKQQKRNAGGQQPRTKIRLIVFADKAEAKVNAVFQHLNHYCYQVSQSKLFY